MKKNYIKLIALICLIALSNLAKAQLKDCNAFLQGNYIEIGVNHNGSYGSSTNPPAGYHGNCHDHTLNSTTCLTSSSGFFLGLIADPARDGWIPESSGSAGFYGDFCLPGVSFEGWSILTDNLVQANNWNGNASSKTVNGTNVSYTSIGKYRASEWEGIHDSLKIIQRTILDTANTYFVIRTTIVNLAGKRRKNIFYSRFIDPDNDQLFSSNFKCLNKLDYQLPNPKNITLVSARGTVYNDAYLGIATKDKRAKAYINISGGYAPVYKIADQYYDLVPSTYIKKMGDSVVGDLGIGLIYMIDTLEAYDSTVLKMAYIFGGVKDIDSAVEDDGLIDTTKIPTSISTINTSTNSTIQITPNPFQNQLLINGLEKNDKIEIYNVQGVKMKSEWSENNLVRTLNTSSLPFGLYVIVVSSEDGVLKLRKIIQHN